MENELCAIKNEKNIAESEWKHAIERAADYIRRHPLKDITLFILLRSIDDKKFLNLSDEEAKRFLEDLAREATFSVKGDVSDRKICIIKYESGGIIKKCRNALNELIERMGTEDTNAIREDLKKQNYTQDTIEIAMELRKLDAIRKNIAKLGQ